MHEVVGSQWFWPETGLQVPQTGSTTPADTIVAVDARRRAAVVRKVDLILVIKLSCLDVLCDFLLYAEIIS